VSSLDPSLIRRLEAAVVRMSDAQRARIAERGPDSVVLVLESDLPLGEAALAEVRRKVHALCLAAPRSSRTKAG
jgi:hypothetical protein